MAKSVPVKILKRRMIFVPGSGGGGGGTKATGEAERAATMDVPGIEMMRSAPVLNVG